MKMLSIITALIASGCLAACGQTPTKQFHGIYANNSEGLHNPERGLRLEVALDVETWNSDTAGITGLLEQEARKYASDSLTLVQTYFYLTHLAGKPVAQKHFAAMQTFLNKLRELGMKAVLRFAYERDFKGRAATGPTEADIKRHTGQLKPFLAANSDVIAVVQAGFIGAWGEWHGSVHGLENTAETKKNILARICDMTPANRMIQVRVPAYKNLLKDDTARYNRLSFHDDFIVIKPHVWDGGLSEGTPAYAQIVAESPALMVDGELPWGFWSAHQDPDDPHSGWLINGAQTARRLFLQHFTSLSAIHNYKERSAADKFSMQYWKETPISEAFLSAHKMPFSETYFQKSDGTPAARSEFEYIRDHLGYRIELQELGTNPEWKKGSAHRVDISLINRGFSTLFNEHPVFLVLIDTAGNVCHSAPTGANVHHWQPHHPQDASRTPLVHRISASVDLPATFPAGVYQLGLWIPDGSEKLMYNPRYAIRCANSDVPWVSTAAGYGVNSLIDIRVL
jgi:hypothetical protein